MATNTASEKAEPSGALPSARTRPSGGGSASAGAVRRAVRRFGIWIPLGLLALWTFVPFLVTLSISLKTRTAVFASPGLLPSSPSLAAYGEVIARPGFQGAFVNSVVVGAGTTFLTLLLGVPAAYAFARFNFRGRHLLLLFTLLPRLVPGLGLMVPLYRLAVSLGLLDKQVTLIIVYTGMTLPLAVWLLVGFFQAIPKELEEAANVDGASLWERLRYLVLPMAFPALITIGVLAFREAWNEFTLVLVLTTTPGKRTLPYELFLMQGIGVQNYPAEAAFALLTVIPFILVYMRIERYVVQGISTGSSK